ncbi:phage repressor protein C with HTH and peptisase S24 domain [Desulfomicrobium macestii]|uniref:Phage repressor protein C, contains Cro/C1-type HTH and peptisase s24 domains n=2 Tax=Desulfomicrobium TaxID=898 RepID=A0A8G2C5B3_DESNO|nr:MULTISPECIES: S24 family peptidase [Desulfomicrobium]MBE1427226.1 phage repressor protein C with HTH and peptisase S24 domain [Desulfomicrobium macestii]SFM09500.1 Phage repressor protein C, contains Cro/C1-type HTH and peptisase s24 domains [Desulfomicrobium norvegicum]
MKFDDFFQRVAKTTGISTQKELAALLGIDPAAITMAKGRGVPKSWGLTIAAAFGVNPGWLKTGTGPVYQNEQASTLLVPKVAARACAGGGSFELSDKIVDELPFDRSWLSKKGNPGQMVAMEVIGDSMSPELEPGDNILIDQSQNQVADNNLYVVGLADSIQVKRIQVRPGLVVLFSTNQRYSPVTLQGDEIDTLRVIGRVLWSSRAYA